jgi:hypothetical protein
MVTTARQTIITSTKTPANMWLKYADTPNRPTKNAAKAKRIANWASTNTVSIGPGARGIDTHNSATKTAPTNWMAEKRGRLAPLNSVGYSWRNTQTAPHPQTAR